MIEQRVVEIEEDGPRHQRLRRSLARRSALAAFEAPRRPETRLAPIGGAALGGAALVLDGGRRVAGGLGHAPAVSARAGATDRGDRGALRRRSRSFAIVGRARQSARAGNWRRRRHWYAASPGGPACDRFRNLPSGVRRLYPGGIGALRRRPARAGRAARATPGAAAAAGTATAGGGAPRRTTGGRWRSPRVFPRTPAASARRGRRRPSAAGCGTGTAG